jgi:hypothetical protein
MLALFALVAVSGFAAADRLPHQVPENQVFSIDTLIDVTGTVTDSSQLQWTIDSMERKYSRAVIASDSLPYAVPASLIDAAKDAGYAVRYYVDNGVYYLTQLDVPDDKLSSYISQTSTAWNGWTWGDIIDELTDDNNDYAYETYTDQGEIHNSVLEPTEEIAIATYTDSIRTNGGKLSENKNVAFDSQDKGKGLSNLEATKVITYASTEGAHLIGSEEWNLDVAGNYENTADTIRCVFASAKSTIWPAFCNAVKAKSELVNVNSAQISTKGNLRAVAASGDVPAEMNYQIAVTPDSNSGSGFAEGTVKTQFGGAIMEARGKNNVPSATNSWNDKTEVTGGIKNFQKTFAYQSGFRF